MFHSRPEPSLQAEHMSAAPRQQLPPAAFYGTLSASSKTILPVLYASCNGVKNKCQPHTAWQQQLSRTVAAASCNGMSKEHRISTGSVDHTIRQTSKRFCVCMFYALAQK